MVRAARRYDFYLPLNFNNGLPVPNDLLDSIEERLLGRFEGLTSQKREFPFNGIWQSKGQVFQDPIVLMTVLDFRPSGSSRFVGQLKTILLEELDQVEILITEIKLRVH